MLGDDSPDLVIGEVVSVGYFEYSLCHFISMTAVFISSPVVRVGVLAVITDTHVIFRIM